MTLAHPPPRCHHAQVPGSAEYTAAMGAFVEAAKSGMSGLFEIAFSADSGVSAQPPAFLAALARRDAHVHQAVRGAEELEPEAGSGVKAQSKANMLLCQSWQRHNNAMLACRRNPTLLWRDGGAEPSPPPGPLGPRRGVPGLAATQSANYRRQPPPAPKCVAAATAPLRANRARVRSVAVGTGGPNKHPPWQVAAQQQRCRSRCAAG